jgi:branched-subunit amino acid transport protein
VSAAWATVLGLGVVSVVIRAFGPVFFGGRELPPRVQDVLGLIGPAVIAAVVTVQVFATDGALVVDSRVIGLVTGLTAALLRAPLIVVVLASVAVTTAVRALG